MKKVLIATTNNDKYDAVSKIFKATIFRETDYIIEKLTDDMNIPDEKECGNNVDRARVKALNAHSVLKDDYDYIVGLDDAIRIKGRLEPNIKEYINKILFENYLDEGEEYSFNRAYCIIDKDGNTYETNIDIPYSYHNLESSFDLKERSYPLSHVSCPIGTTTPIADIIEAEQLDYYLKYVKEDLLKLNIN